MRTSNRQILRPTNEEPAPGGRERIVMSIHRVKEFRILDSIYWKNDVPETTRFFIRTFPTRSMVCLRRKSHGKHHDKHPDDIKMSVEDLRSLVKKEEVSHSRW